MEYVQNAPVRVYTCVYEWCICECGYVCTCLCECGVCVRCMSVQLQCTNLYTSKQYAYTTENTCMACGIRL